MIPKTTKNKRQQVSLAQQNRGEIFYQIIIQIIIVALIFALFFVATVDKANSRGVKQQVLEKELALLIDSASSGMDFSVKKLNLNGVVTSLQIKEGRVFAYVDNQQFSKGYPFFTKYSVGVEDKGDLYLIRVR